MGLFILWWFFDDHLAAAVATPGLGHVDWWVMLLLSLAISLTVNVNRSKA